MTPLGQLRLACRFALREMRGGLSGFFIFLACIALGVGAIGGVSSVAEAITGAIEAEGQSILGGDLRFELVQRQASEAEEAYFNSLGDVAVSAGMRSMARRVDGSDQALVEVKAVDDAYPLYGSLETEPQLDHAALFGVVDGSHGAVVAPLLLERLGLQVGDRIALGNAELHIRATVVSEPDLLSDGIGFAPRLMVSLDGLAATGLIQPGSLIEFRYRIRMAGASEAAIAAAIAEAGERFPEAGWSVRSRSSAAPALANNVERFSQFLALVGLTALIVGGVGVANAVRAFLDGKRGVIATFKCLGAPGRLVVQIYLVQILLIAALGIAIGLAIAAAMPFAAEAVLREFLPLPAAAGLHPLALATGALFGLLVTLAFALLPLGRTRDVPATALFREMGYEARGLPRAPYLAASLAIVALLAGLAIALSSDRRIAVIFLGAMVFSFVVLRIVAIAVQAAARRAPRTRSTVLRLATGNIHRPGALTPSVVLSLGLGLTLLATLALIDGDLRRQIRSNIPSIAPNFFFVDIQNTEIEAFASLIESEAPGGKLIRVPMLRGRVVALDGTPIEQLDIPPAAAWVLRGDRGLTYARNIPENSTLAAGTWWSEDHDGPPLVSFSAQEARELGLDIGDTVTVNVLGRNLTATIANLREVQWESLGINFVMVFSPNSFAGAPHSWLATLSGAENAPGGEAGILNAVTRAFPAVTTVRVQDALDVVNRVVSQLGNAIRAAASVALIASVLVLAGALAAGNRARIHDAVVLKTLGATRRTLIAAFTLEYLLIGLATAIFALAAGSVAAWFVVSRIMLLPATFQPEVAAFTIALALVLTIGIGLAGTWRILGHRAAPVLRNL